jgi:hypothetical protein
MSERPEPYLTNERMVAKLNMLTRVAQSAGAEGIFLIRGAENASLKYELPGDLAPLEMALANAPLLLVIRFPAGDGGEPGVEHR